LNCSAAQPPCGTCPSCQKIAQDRHPDVHTIVGEGAGETIKIDQIRTLQRQVFLAPYEGRYRVAILRQMDRATVEAANSLLKTLEEPPAHVVLVLTAVDAESMPRTVVSRCQRLNLRPASIQQVEATLRDRGAPLDSAQLVARLSGGRLGWAIETINDERAQRRRQQTLDQLVELLSANRVERLDYAWKSSQKPAKNQQQLQTWMSWWRDLLLFCSRGEAAVDEVANLDRVTELRWLAGQATLQQAMRGVRALQTTAKHLEANVNTRLALEDLLLRFPHWPSPPADRAKDPAV
jgi:DNA polymerase-3 subunit delta'